MFRFWGSQEPEAQSRLQDTLSQSSWFASSAGGTTTSSRPTTPSSRNSSSFNFKTHSLPHMSLLLKLQEL
ncbi:unnamed protein product [Rhodiola kirilowii]